LVYALITHRGFEGLVCTPYQRKRSKLVRFQWNQVAKMARRLLIIVVITQFLETFMFTLTSCQIITISAYLSPLKG